MARIQVSDDVWPEFRAIVEILARAREQQAALDAIVARLEAVRGCGQGDG